MKLYKKLFSYMPEKKINGILSLIFTAFGCFIQFYAYYLIWQILFNVFTQRNSLNIKSSVSIVLLLFIGQAVLYIIGTWMSHLAAFRLETRLREKGAENLLKASKTFFDTHQSGEVRKIIDNNVEQTHMSVAHLIPDHTAAIITPILLLILVFNIDLYLGIFFVTIVLISMFLLYKMSGEKDFTIAYMKKSDELNGQAVEYVRGLPVVKIFNAPLIGFKKLYRTINDYRDMVYEYSMSCRLPFVSFQWVLNIFIITPIFIAIYMVKNGADPYLWSAKILFFTLFMGLFFSDLMKIMYVGLYNVEANTAVDNLESLFDEMKDNAITYGNDEFIENYSIEFKNVSFSYDKKTKVIDNLSFKLDQGKVYALVGPSGGGKSTIAKLISSLYPIDSGEILIGNKNIYSYRRETLMDNIGMVYQNPKLFQGISIFENVKLAKKDASEKEVYDALKLAKCDQFIDRFEDGYDSIIGSSGVNLSGGEIQRVSIARIFLKDPKVIILDEASAAADPENEYELQQAFKSLMEGKTVIMIAHRLSSIRGVDEILVVEDGNIIERGSHDYLMEKEARYKQFVDLYDEANQWRIS
ncbi:MULTISPECIES: ABC transporter ATP-binding protein [Anaerococcus]|uniref:ABC transporter ATP-binding protein n=1 Tax=Anaerococcus nagyae TaxID=1755241 RepID=A0A3E2TLG1_9FIRM|nr:MULTISPECIES: ABC transporter ATP-binding protein [Anaerococcus]MDU2566510.1 ABC transporter ATP-binding protein [Anaerococcus sp.]RGB78182.1 ABC transporter ATP-binding protein [Anaerococcus nagyae]